MPALTSSLAVAGEAHSQWVGAVQMALGGQEVALKMFREELVRMSPGLAPVLLQEDMRWWAAYYTAETDSIMAQAAAARESSEQTLPPAQPVDLGFFKIGISELEQVRSGAVAEGHSGGGGGEGAAKAVKRPRQQPAQPPIRQLLGAAHAQTAHPATFSTAPSHQRLGSANAETTPARAPAAAADRTQRPDAKCEGENA